MIYQLVCHISHTSTAVTGLFAPKTIPFAPGSESSRCGTFAPWNFRSLERERNKAKQKFQLWNCRITCIYTFKILSLFPLVQPIRAENRNLVGAVLRNQKKLPMCHAPAERYTANGTDNRKNTRYGESKNMRYRKSKLTCFSIVTKVRLAHYLLKRI